MATRGCYRCHHHGFKDSRKAREGHKGTKAVKRREERGEESRPDAKSNSTLSLLLVNVCI